jgi:hypothetical protein
MTRNPLANEKGVALLVALGAFVLVSVLGVASLTVAGGSINQTVWDRSSNQAFNLAEGGFNWAVAKAREEPPTLAAGTYNLKLTNGEALVTVEDVGGMGYIFRVKSVGGQPNLTEPKARRAVEGHITAINPYNVLLATSAAGTILGSAVIDGPLYVYDILELSGNGAVLTGPLFIKNNPATAEYTGDLVLKSSGPTIGKSDKKIYAFIDGRIEVPQPSSQLHTHAIYTDVPDLNMPVINGDNIEGQKNDAHLVINQPLMLNKNVASAEWGSATGPGHLKWTGGNSPKLEVKGKIYVEGLVRLGGTGNEKTDDIEFAGKGTMVANGFIQIHSPLVPKTSFPDVDIVGLVSPYQVTIENLGPSDKVYASLYGYEKIYFDKPMEFFGSLMTKELDIKSNPKLHMHPDVAENLPAGMPEVPTSTTITGWREVKP